MINVNIVGVGSLGSTIAVECAKRALATDITLKIHLHDYDVVEKRNTISQYFNPGDIGETKAQVIAYNLHSYNPLVSCTYNTDKITNLNIGNKIITTSEEYDQNIIIDVVDNLETRQLLWKFGMIKDIPVLHAGMSISENGYVNWNFRQYNTFSLSPEHLKPKTKEDILKNEGIKIPPCELSSYRTLILNTSMAVVNALFIYLGSDIAKFVGEDTQGILTNWSTSITGMNLIKEMNYVSNN